MGGTCADRLLPFSSLTVLKEYYLTQMSEVVYSKNLSDDYRELSRHPVVIGGILLDPEAKDAVELALMMLKWPADSYVELF
jgi:hypothetical protein